MRVRTQADKLDRRTIKLSHFKGVDYSSAPTEIAPQRAAQMQNLLLDDGTLCKRKGWEQIYKLDGRINGVWEYTDQGRWYTQSVLIVHVGTAIYEIKERTAELRLLSADISTITDARSYGVVKNKKLYILCGDYLAYGHFSDSEADIYELRRVANDVDTFVPTTSIGIPYAGGQGESHVHDDVNLLQKLRKNTFQVSGSGYSSYKSYYKVDTGMIPPGTEVRVKIWGQKNGVFGEYEFGNVWYDKQGNKNITDTLYPLPIELLPSTGAPNYSDRFGVIDQTHGTIHVFKGYDYQRMEVTFDGSFVACEQEESLFEGLAFSLAEENHYVSEQGIMLNAPISLDIYERCKYFSPKGRLVPSFRITGYSPALLGLHSKRKPTSGDSVPLEDETCVIKETDFKEDWTVSDYLQSGSVGTFSGNAIYLNAEYSGKSCTVTYIREEPKYYKPFDQSEQIAHCKTGCLFGVDGANDRLFMAGDPDTPNICYNSAIDDFTYFPDQQTAACGEENSRITGFSRLGDGTLAVFKDTRNSADVGVYYRTGERIPETDDAGNTIYKEIFPLKAGAIGVGCVTPHATANLAGDPLMLADSGVYGIMLSSNVASDERYARERSRTIGAAFKGHDLSDAAAIVYDNRYYLSIGDTCFVADARYKYTLDADMDDTYNYEWFRLTDIPARVWIVLQGELCFGTSDGRICRFHDRYCDVKKDRIDQDSGQLTVSGGRMSFNKELYPLISQATYYLDDMGVRHEITDLQESSFACDLSEGTVGSTFVTEVPVRAEWWSGLNDLGSSGLNKNLYALSVNQTPVEKGRLQCGYKVKRGQQTVDAAVGRAFDGFGALNFGDFCFEADGFQSVSYCRVFERGLIHLQLFFISDGECDCRVTELKAEYGLTNKYIGAW